MSDKKSNARSFSRVFFSSKTQGYDQIVEGTVLLGTHPSVKHFESREHRNEDRLQWTFDRDSSMPSFENGLQ